MPANWVRQGLPLKRGGFDGGLFGEVVLADALSHGEYKIRELKATKKTSPGVVM